MSFGCSKSGKRLTAGGTVVRPFILRNAETASLECEGHENRLVHDEAQADVPAESPPSEDAADSSPRGTE